MSRPVQAAVLRGVGQPQTVEPIELVPTGPHQVRVRLGAAGVCHSDLSVRDGSIPFMFPTVLGHEGAGTVVEVGDQVTRVAPGDRVVLSWMPSCGRCRFCLAGQPALCPVGLGDALFSPFASVAGDALVRGLGVGCFAEETLLPEGAVVPIPGAIGLEDAALVGCALATGVGAVWHTARLPPAATAAVVGCGAVGLAVVQGARLAGASRIVAVDTLAPKLELAARLGATDTVDASAGDPVEAVRELTGGDGVDFAFEVVGRSATIRQAFAMARRGGTAVLVGAGSADDPVTFTAMELFADAKTLVGCVYGSARPERDFPVLVDEVRRGRIDTASLVTARIGLDDLDAAFDALAEGRAVRSVVVFEGGE